MQAIEAVVQLRIDGPGLGELIFENDDAARGIYCGTTIDQFAGSGRDSQLVTGVAAVSSLGALRDEQFRLVEASEESRSGAKNLRGATHRVRGIIFVIEFVVRAFDWARTFL